MHTNRALTIPSLMAALCVGLGCSSNSDGDTIFETGTGGASSAGGSTASGATGNSGSGITGGSGPITIGGNTGTAGGEGVGGGCTGVSTGATPLPPILEFLIDYSGSMNDPTTTPDGQMVPKYKATATALVDAFTDMEDGTGTGLIFYPNVGTSGGKGGGGASCITKQEAVPIQLLNATVRQSLITALNAKRTSGATPTHDAFMYAAERLGASTLMGNKHVVLVTDGSPTYSLGCMGDGRMPVDNGPLVQAVANANTMNNIKTFVIGSPGSEDARASLSEMATQGGTAPAGCSNTGPNYCHFDMTTAPDLSAALNAAIKAITGSIISCNYPIPSPPGGKVINLNEVNVNFTSSSSGTLTVTKVGKDPDPAGIACNKGWQYSADQKQIILCPDTCNLVTTDPNAKIDVVFGCKTNVL